VGKYGFKIYQIKRETPIKTVRMNISKAVRVKQI
jgi:hypothetical protein